MSQTKPNILVFGVGSIGSVYAAIFALSQECQVYLVARSNYEVLKNKGLTLTSSKFGNHDSLRFAGVFRSCEEAAVHGVKYDYLVCANKALLDSRPSLSEQLKPLVGEGTSIVLFQNGVGAEEPLHEAFPATTVVSACVWTGARILDIGHVEQFNREALTIGVDYTSSLPRQAQDAHLDRFVAVLQAGGSELVVVQDIQSERWVKVIWNACWNSVTTVTQLRTNRFLSASPQGLTLSRSIMSEVAAVARAKGLHVPEGTEEKLIKQCVDVKEGLPSSMMFDCIAGRAMEVEVILGTPLREGLRLGVPVPSLTAMYAIIKALDWRNAHPDEAKV